MQKGLRLPVAIGTKVTSEGQSGVVLTVWTAGGPISRTATRSDVKANALWVRVQVESEKGMSQEDWDIRKTYRA